MSPISKVYLSLVAGLLFFCTALAQKPWNLQWGAPHKPENPGSIHAIVHSDQQGYYALRCRIPEWLLSNKSHKAALELYDKKLNFVRSEAIDLEYKDESLELASFVSLKDKHFLLTSYYNAKQEKKYLFARSVNMQTLKCEGEYTKIMEMQVSSKLRLPYFAIKSSPDSSLLLVYGTLSSQDGKKESFSLAVMDANMKVLWAKDLELPYSLKEAGVVSYCRPGLCRTTIGRPYSLKEAGVVSYTIDNQGNAYLMVARHRSKKEKKKNEEMDTYYCVFAYTNSGATLKEYEATLGEKHITDIAFEVLKNGDIFCIGYYSDKGEDFWDGLKKAKERVKGVFSYKLNGLDGRVYDKTVQEFNSDIRNSDLSSRKQEKEKKDNSERELMGYFIRTLHIQEDGSILLVGERFYFAKVPKGGTSNETYEVAHHDDLLVAKLSPNGQMIWACKVDKKQKGMAGYQFAYIPTPEKQYFFYKNGYGRSDKMNLATVALNGKVAYSPFDVEDVEVQNGTMLSPSSKTLIVWPESDSKSRLGKIVFQ